MKRTSRPFAIKQMHNLIKPYGGAEKVARYLVEHRHVSLGQIESRLETAERVGLVEKGGDGKGLIHLIGRTQPHFLQRVKLRQNGMSDKQRIALDFLTKKLCIPQELALKLSSTHVASESVFKERARVIASIELPVEKYGVKRIPLSLYKNIIHLPPTKIKRYVEGMVLRVLENRFSSKILDSVFPLWKRFAQLKGIEPRTILAKVEYMIQEGIALSGRKIRQYSIQELKQRKTELDKMTPLEKKTFIERLAQARTDAIKS